MSDDRDLDELLASLDALLREGESHNDDAEDTDTAPVAASAARKAPKSAPKADRAKPQNEAPAKPAKKSSAAAKTERKAQQPDTTDEGEAEEVPHFLVEPGEEAEVPAASGGNDDETAEETGEGAGGKQSVAPVNRVVLTEDMLVDNHQAQLPLKPAAGKKAAAGLSDEQMKQLAAQVRRDITLQLQAKLPQWIEQSIRKHLQKPTDQTKE